MSTIRTVMFPDTGLPGTVHYLHVPEWGDILQGEVEPRGAVELPADAELILVADGDLDGLASMPPDTFMQLELTQVTDHSLEAVGRMTGVALLSLTGTFTDAGLAALAGLGELQTLVLESPYITGLAPLPRAPITELCLAGNRITDEVFETVTDLPLNSLSLVSDAVTGHGLGSLRRATGLQALSLMGIALRPQALRRLAGLPALETVSIIPAVIDETLADALLSLMPPLTEIDVAPQYGELDPGTVSRLLSAGLMVNGVLSSPQSAPAFARALAEHARDLQAADLQAIDLEATYLEATDLGATDLGDGEPEHTGHKGGRAASAARDSLLDIVREDDLDLLLEQPTPVLVECAASWCRPCAPLTRALEQIVAESHDRLAGVALDIDRASWATDRFDVQSVPTTLLFRDGEELLRFAGAQPKGQIEKMISIVLG